MIRSHPSTQRNDTPSPTTTLFGVLLGSTGSTAITLPVSASAPSLRNSNFTVLVDESAVLSPVTVTCTSTTADAASLPSGLQLFRSEEHTSELQSLMRISYAVFCLKKQKNEDML